MAARCGICEAGDRDFGILIASVGIPGQLTNDKMVNAYARLGPWVTHVRELAGGAEAHLAGLSELKNLSGTAYLRNGMDALSNPKLQDANLAAMRRSVQDEVIASALVLIITGQHISPSPVHGAWAERIARSWGWSGPRPDWPRGAGQHANL